jgi:hypothetical protein
MEPLRYLLLIVAAACFVVLTYGMWMDYHHIYWQTYVVWIGLALMVAVWTYRALDRR